MNLNITKQQRMYLRVTELSEVKVVFVTCHLCLDGEYKMITASNMDFPHDPDIADYVLNLMEDMFFAQRSFLKPNEQAVFVTPYIPSYYLKTTTKDFFYTYENYNILRSNESMENIFLANEMMDIFVRSITEMKEVLISKKLYSPFKLSYETNLYKTIDEKVNSKAYAGRIAYRQSYMIKKTGDIKVYNNLGYILRSKAEKKYQSEFHWNVLERLHLWINRARMRIKKRVKDIEDKKSYEQYKLNKKERLKKNSRKKPKLDIYGDPIAPDPKPRIESQRRRRTNLGYTPYTRWNPKRKYLHITKIFINRGFVTFVKPWVYSSSTINTDEYLGITYDRISEVIKKVNEIPRHLRKFVTINEVRNFVNGNIDALNDSKVSFLTELNNLDKSNNKIIY